MTSPEQTAITALREATRVLSVGGHAAANRQNSGEPRQPSVATEVADLLDAASRLLHSIDLEPRSEPGHNLHAVSQHMNAGAQLARRTAYKHHIGGAHSDHPEKRFTAD